MWWPVQSLDSNVNVKLTHVYAGTDKERLCVDEERFIHHPALWGHHSRAQSPRIVAGPRKRAFANGISGLYTQFSNAAAILGFTWLFIYREVHPVIREVFSGKCLKGCVLERKLLTIYSCTHSLKHLTLNLSWRNGPPGILCPQSKLNKPATSNNQMQVASLAIHG